MLVLDANILVHAVLGHRVRQLVETYAAQRGLAAATKVDRHFALAPLGADLYPHLRLNTGGAWLEPQRGEPTEPRPTAWVLGAP